MQGPWFFALGEGSRTRLVLSLFETRRESTYHPFEGLPPIFKLMPAIHHLLGGRRAKLGPTSIFAGPISTDPLHIRVSAEPLGERFCGPVRQHIDWTMPLPVNQQRAVREAMTQCNI